MKVYRLKRVTHDDLRKFLPEIGFQCTPVAPHIFYAIGGKMRYYFTTHGLRYEEKRRDGSWVRVRSAYLKDLTFVHGRLKGLKIGGMNG